VGAWRAGEEVGEHGPQGVKKRRKIASLAQFWGDMRRKHLKKNCKKRRENWGELGGKTVNGRTRGGKSNCTQRGATYWSTNGYEKIGSKRWGRESGVEPKLRKEKGDHRKKRRRQWTQRISSESQGGQETRSTQRPRRKLSLPTMNQTRKNERGDVDYCEKRQERSGVMPKKTNRG